MLESEIMANKIISVTRQNLTDAFCILLKKNPVQKITIRAICEKAGYNRSTFYKYFRDVYDVLEYVENIVITQVKENFQRNISPENFGETFFAAFTKIQSDKAVYFDVLFNLYNRQRFVEKIIREVSPIFIKMFNLPPENPKSKYLTEIYFQTVLSALISWIKNNRDINLAEISKILGNVLTLGVVTEISKESLK